jgi:hypothetical protein
MKPICIIALLFSNILNYSFIYAQQDNSSCKVIMKELTGTYTGECKKGLADGKGEASGLQHYTGMFKDGMPNGTGIYNYSESEYYNGNFQDGIKEGKGEMHYIRKGMDDSIVKGYWSGGEFKGSKYITYTFTTTEQFDMTEITPSKISGNTISFEIGTTSGSPNGATDPINRFVLMLTNIVSPNGCILKTTSKYESAYKSYLTLELVGFPCKLFGTLTDNQTFEFELLESAFL